jgi:hypothetical protein
MSYDDAGTIRRVDISTQKYLDTLRLASDSKWYDCYVGVNFADDGSAIENDNAGSLTKAVGKTVFVSGSFSSSATSKSCEANPSHT